MKVQTLVPELPLEAFDEAILHRFPGIAMGNADMMFIAPARKAFVVHSGPLSTIMFCGFPLVSMSLSRTSVTVFAGIDVSTWMAGHSRP